MSAQQLQTLLQHCFPGYPSRSYFKLPPHFRYLVMADGGLVSQMGVELRMIRVGRTVLRTFGVFGPVRADEASGRTAWPAPAGGGDRARRCVRGGLCHPVRRRQPSLPQERVGTPANPCSWLKIHDHTTLGLAPAQDTNALMVKKTGQQPWPDGEVDLLGHLF